MNDKRIIALLTRRAAGEISAEESSELRDLLSAHPDGVYYEEFFSELWSSGGDAGASAAFFARHRQRHAGRLEFSAPATVAVPAGGGGFRRRGLVACGLAFLAVLCGFLVWVFGGDPVPERIEIVSERGMRKQIVLPDGTKVWLNADSRLSYDGMMEGSGPRNVWLEGEAYFDVRRNRHRPFTITTDKISIRVLGTTFNVKAYPDDRETEATLISGEIELSVNERPKEKILLKPSEKVAVVDHPQAGERQGDGDEKRITLTIGNLSKVQLDDQEYIRETLWMDNKLVVKDETLEDILPKLERWYNVDITLKDPRIRAYRYTATITEEDIHDVLEAMQLIKSFHFKVDSNDVIIY